MADLLLKLKKANLVGRGGASYPVWQKWQAVNDAILNPLAVGDSGQAGKFVVCNCSEGEPGVHKDGYIISHHAERIINGMKLAIEYLGAKQGIFYLNSNYYRNFKKLLENEIVKSGAPIVLFEKLHIAGYIGGEETTLLNVIEGGRPEPRLRPPFPTTHGLWNQPTLVQNVETYYDISLVASNEYESKRFIGVTGDCMFEGVYEFLATSTIEEVLKATKNYPNFDFFVQIGGDGSGEILNHKQLKVPASGCGSIHVYSVMKYRPHELIQGWVRFFKNESCGKCTPCREGTNRLVNILAESRPDWSMIKMLLDNLRDTAFCGLGMAVPIPIETYIKNVIAVFDEKILKLTSVERQLILATFKVK
ncbi:MAG: NADH-ubiquinone oxidoreductase-F iron-sulfur binding region domain-containing protein [bacterium]